MAYFFSNITQVKTFIGGGVNRSLEITSLDSSLLVALQQHLRPWLGSDFTTELLDAWAASILEDDPVPLSAEQTALLPYIQRPLAMLAMYEYAKIGSIQFGENGIFRIEGENMKGAYKYQENQYKEAMLHNGYEAIEDMLIFLNTNRADYTTWDVSDEAARSRELFINTAAEFRLAYSKHITRYTFEMLRGIVEDVQLFAIRPLIGEDEYEALKTAIAGTDPLTAPQKALLKVIQKAVAAFTVKEAVQKMWLRIEGNKLVQSEHLEPQSYEKDSPPGANVISLQLYQQDVWANRLLSNITRVLEATPDDYPLYTAYAEALAEAAAAEEESEACSELCERCGHYGYCDGCRTSGYSEPTSKGIVRL